MDENDANLLSLTTLRVTKRFSVFHPITLREAAHRMLKLQNNSNIKAKATFYFCKAWKNSDIATITDDYAESLKAPTVIPLNTPKKVSVPRNTIELTIHGIAHAEFRAIDLFWDSIFHFSGTDMPMEFFDDQCYIVEQEARHFSSWFNRLKTSSYPYKSLPTHDGLLRDAGQTNHCLLSRLAIINMMHEARGLDTFPMSSEKFVKANDKVSIEILKNNYKEEIYHVAVGVKWFKYLCEKDNKNPADTFISLLKTHKLGGLKGPFNHEARTAAGLKEDWYMPLVE